MLTTFCFLFLSTSLTLAGEAGTGEISVADKATADKTTADKSAADKSAAKEALKPIPKPEFTNAGHTVDDVKAVHGFVKSKRAVLLDVREQREWDAGRLKLAKLVPLSVIRNGELPEKIRKMLPKDKPVYLHCLSGGRVLMAAEILKSQGYDVRPLRSGYEKLLKAGFDKAKPKAEEQK
ncbi:MAG: rhodanese-like domain-containing protein [Fuerstiella sp.]